jgi:hypothetical protein
MSEQAKITDAYAEWDDRAGKFRVYLEREDGSDPEPLRPLMGVDPLDDKTEARLYRAAFVACPRDIGPLTTGRGEGLGWEKEAPAKRVANAVKKELAAMAKGKPGPSDMAIQIALVMVPKKRERA